MKFDLTSSLILDPSSRITSKQKFPGPVITEDQEGEWHGRQPPADLEGVHPQALVHAWGVGKEGSEESLGPKFMK